MYNVLLKYNEKQKKLLLGIGNPYMIDAHQLLLQDLAAGLYVVQGEVGVEELPRLHLLVDDVVNQVADFLFVGVFQTM